MQKNRESDLTISDAFNSVFNQLMVATASDFHICLGGDIYIMYTCGGCCTAPIDSKYWLRCTSEAGNNVAGTITEKGKWVCGKGL